MDKPPLHDIISPSSSPRRAPTTAGIKRPQPPKRKFTPPSSGRSSHLGVWITVIVLLAVVAFAFSFLFSGATVTVTPKQQDVFIDGVFAASESTLKFNIMKIEETLSDTVKATETEDAEERAQGTIIVYNNYNTSSHGWVKNTRFETPEGLIYKVRKSVVIPGMRTVNGKKVPGSIEIIVTADEPGEKYNIGLTDFTIPGLKGGAKYESFYARSKTPMTGGFVGERLVVSDSVLLETRDTLQEDLRQKLLILAASQRPEGFLLFESGISFMFESIPNVDSKNQVAIEEKGTLYAILFDEEEFAGYLAKSTMADYDENIVKIINTDDLEVVFDDGDGNLWESDEITFSVNGTATFEWFFDIDDLRIDLLGESKDTISSVLRGYPGILEAEATIRPFWHGTFPTKSEKIKIEKK